MSGAWWDRGELDAVLEWVAGRPGAHEGLEGLASMRAALPGRDARSSRQLSVADSRAVELVEESL
ncbi:hypothetical protein C0L86_30130 [Streptomyces sp. SCA2-2]|nr:hypothetical protein C0L86_30130 [Streptomyces sp. SCA2-2]